MGEVLTVTVQFTHMGERPLRNTNAKWLVDFGLTTTKLLIPDP